MLYKYFLRYPVVPQSGFPYPCFQDMGEQETVLALVKEEC
jgi:hypothetical protein